MAESIFARISRLVSANVEDSVDRLEQVGGEGVMREAIREADRAVDQVKSQLDHVAGRRLQAKRQHQMLARRIDEMNAKAAFALDEGREDLAEAALSRQVDFEAQAVALEEVQSQARDEEKQLDEGLTALKARKTQMEEALASYLLARRDTASAGGFSRPTRSAEKAVDAAEAAFDRAMTGAGGASLKRTDADTIHRVAEIDSMQKSATIAARLAALKRHRAA